MSVDSGGGEANGDSGYNILFPSDMSADGRYVAFASFASNLVPGDNNSCGNWLPSCPDVFVHDRHTGTTQRVSVDSSGAEANDESRWSGISDDGQFVVFMSAATNLVPGDTNGASDTFVHDRQTGVTERVSVDSSGAEGNGGSGGQSISADGSYVAFASSSTNLVAGDTNGETDVFVHDRQTGLTERVSLDNTGSQGNGYATEPKISSDGRYVAFRSSSTNLVAGDTNASYDLFVRDRQTGATARVSVDSTGAEGNDHSWLPSISADGRFIAFFSYATNLVTGDTNGVHDVFVHDRQNGTTERVSVDSDGNPSNGISQTWFGRSISADGRYVSFQSLGSNLVPNDTNYATDIFVHDRQKGTTERVSVDSSGAQGDGGYNEAISGDGRFVAFASGATNLVAGDTNGAVDVFLHDRGTCPTMPWTVPPGDSDCDGFTDTDEGVIGTDPADPCANTPDPNDEADDRWPPDFDDNQVINVLDMGEVLPPYFGTSVPPTETRRDLVPDGVINVLDVGMTLPPYFGFKCSP